MDDNEYYSMMRRQYSCTDFGIVKKSGAAKKKPASDGAYSRWDKLHGHEDAEMLNETDGEKIDLEDVK